MKHLTHLLLAFFWKFGGVGLLILGIFDSSFLFAPLGNDLLVVAMTAYKRSVGGMLYYAGMSTIGSVLGCLLIDVVLRPAGEHGLEKHLSRKRLDYVKCKIEKNAAWALIFASIAPPPFPFTPFVMAAAALQYPRKKMLIVVGIARMVRFTALGVLALMFGRSILKWAESGVVGGIMLGLIALFIVGSIISVIGWVRRSRKADSPNRGPQPAPAR